MLFCSRFQVLLVRPNPPEKAVALLVPPSTSW